MPKKAKSSKKEAPVGLSKESVQKIGVIAEKTEEETFEALIHDFDIQAEKLKKQFIRLFRNDVKKMLQFLPQKSSIPKEILNMSAYEFKDRGGSLGAVMESLRREQARESTAPQLPTDINPTLTENTSSTSEVNPNFVTPALNTRRAVTAAVTETSKRKPKALENVALSAHAADSGSPLDEHVFMKLQIGQAVEDFESQLLEATTSFPQKWRSQLQKQIKHTRMQYKTQIEGQFFQTPALFR
ncbi:uncharacterized protein LOC135341522 isoform X2 [Halichondria panicea]|uniref:uncharacterized protein LOC135341522 isoform X2 n=1 Tax=Halichondria panicea TaxID=6063 RepID=UPI00312B77D1